MTRMQKCRLDCNGMTVDEAAQWGNDLCRMQRDVPWMLGDLARYCESRWPDAWQQAFPEWASPGMIDRFRAVAKAYPNEADRNPLASWSIHMREANKPDRIQRVQAHVDAGRTTDEARKHDQEERAKDTRPRWLLCIDVHYHLHRHWFSGAGVEAAVRVTEWVARTVARLKEKGLTDVACAFEGRGSFRKELTTEWEDKYKDRPPKDAELVNQLQLVRELLEAKNFACVSHDRFEADDVMASFAEQFPGKVTLLTGDKDARQCLSDHCNILLDVEWTEDETSGEVLPNYKWLSAKQHTEATGLRPDQWIEYQSLMGDAVDGIKGAVGIGEKGAADLIREFGTIEACIEAAKADDERIKPKRREALIEFEPKLETTRTLVALRRDVPIPGNTRV